MDELRETKRRDINRATDHLFSNRYMKICAEMRLLPSRGVAFSTSSGHLTLAVDLIDEWPPLLTAIRQEHSLTQLTIYSRVRSGSDVDRVRQALVVQLRRTHALLRELSSGFARFPLMSLHLIGVTMPRDQAESLATGLTNLRHLRQFDFGHSRIVANRCRTIDRAWLLIFTALRSLQWLESIRLAGCSLSADAFHLLARLLAEHLRGEEWSESLRYGARNRSIRRLDVSFNDVDDRAAQSLCDAIRDGIALRELYMRDCALSDSSAANLLGALKHGGGGGALRLLDVLDNSLPQQRLDEIEEVLLSRRDSDEPAMRQYSPKSLAESLQHFPSATLRRRSRPAAAARWNSPVAAHSALCDRSVASSSSSSQAGTDSLAGGGASTNNGGEAYLDEEIDETLRLFTDCLHLVEKELHASLPTNVNS